MGNVRHVTRIPNPSRLSCKRTDYKITSFIIVIYIRFEKMCNLKFQSNLKRIGRTGYEYDTMRISECQYYGTSNIFVTKGRMFLKSEKMKSKLRKYLTKNYSSLNQSHDGWLQNTLMILIINVAIFLSCRLMLQIFSLHKSILILDQLQACRPWGCQGCHGTPRFWQIS